MKFPWMNKMRFYLPILVALCMVEHVLGGTLEEDRDVIFAEDGDEPMKPSETLSALQRLSDSYNSDDCEECPEKKEEVDELIEVSRISEEKCNQDQVDRSNNLIMKYAHQLLNIIPYLQHQKELLIKECRDKYNVRDLHPQVKPVTADDLREKPELAQKAEEQKAIREKYANEEETRWAELRKQQRINDDWLKRYNDIFRRNTQHKHPDVLINELDSLYKSHSDTAGNIYIKGLGNDIFDLLRLSYNLVSTCKDESFKSYDTLMTKYASEYSASILDFVKYYRKKLWLQCKASFQEAQRAKQGLREDDRAVVMSIVEHVKAVDQNNRELYYKVELEPVQIGVASYLREVLGNKAHKAESINRYVDETIIPVCESVEHRFEGRDKLDEIIKTRYDLKNDLDTLSLKWMTALKVCKVITGYSSYVKNKSIEQNTKPYREVKSKKKSCFGKLFCIDRKKNKAICEKCGDEKPFCTCNWY